MMGFLIIISFFFFGFSIFYPFTLPYICPYKEKDVRYVDCERDTTEYRKDFMLVRLWNGIDTHIIDQIQKINDLEGRSEDYEFGCNNYQLKNKQDQRERERIYLTHLLEHGSAWSKLRVELSWIPPHYLFLNKDTLVFACK